MEIAALPFKNTFRTKCRLPLPWCLLLGCLLLCVRVCASSSNPGSPRLITYRPESVDGGTDGSVFVLASGEEAGHWRLLLYGEYFTNETRLWLTDQASCSGDGVNLHSLGPLHMLSENGTRATITVPTSTPLGVFHFCISESAAGDAVRELQGSEDDPTLSLMIVNDGTSSKSSRLLPLPAEIAIVAVLIVLSGTFSGLNLGLMSLDPTTLKLVMESGSGRQKIYAKVIYRVRRYGNYLLCTLLLGNVLVNNSLTIILDDILGSGAYAIVASTIAIVIFGEIVPQAICSRHALTIGAFTIWLTYIFMAITFPLSFPISLMLHFILGKEIGAVYTREELLGLLKVTEDHHDIGKDEVQIISGALKFKEKTAEDVMTKFEYVYCLDIQSVLDFKTMREIYDSGFSRIPVYEDTKSNIVGVLYAKDLTFVDPDDETPLKQVLDFYNHELISVYNDTKLNELLEEFAGGKCHLALVNCVVQDGPGDPHLEVVGVVTLEDIVEEILQLEIVDETDRVVDNRSLKPRQRNHVDIGGFMGEAPPDRPHISSQQRLAIYQFLSSSIDAFKSDKVLPNILKLLLNQDVVRRYTLEEAKARNHVLYRANVPATTFTLVLEGHVEVEVGRDGLKFEAGPFHHFGVQVLEMAGDGDKDYVPDFTVRPISECLVLVITCSQYLDARKATMFQKTKDHDSSSSIHVVINHANNTASASPAGVTPTGPRTFISKSAPQLKPPTSKKLRVSREGKGASRLEIQPLLPYSLSEEDEELESDDTATTTSQPHTPDLRLARAELSPLPTPVVVEMQIVNTSTPAATAQSSDPIQLSFTTDPQAILDSSQL